MAFCCQNLSIIAFCFLIISSNPCPYFSCISLSAFSFASQFFFIVNSFSEFFSSILTFSEQSVRSWAIFSAMIYYDCSTYFYRARQDYLALEICYCHWWVRERIVGWVSRSVLVCKVSFRCIRSCSYSDTLRCKYQCSRLISSKAYYVSSLYCFFPTASLPKVCSFPSRTCMVFFNLFTSPQCAYLISLIFSSTLALTLLSQTSFSTATFSTRSSYMTQVYFSYQTVNFLIFCQSSFRSSYLSFWSLSLYLTLIRCSYFQMSSSYFPSSYLICCSYSYLMALTYCKWIVQKSLLLIIKSSVQFLRLSSNSLIYSSLCARIFFLSFSNCSYKVQNCTASFYEYSDRTFIFYCSIRLKDQFRIQVARFQYYLVRDRRYYYLRISYFSQIFRIQDLLLETMRWIQGSMPLRVFQVIYCFFCFYHFYLLYCYCWAHSFLLSLRAFSWFYLSYFWSFSNFFFLLRKFIITQFCCYFALINCSQCSKLVLCLCLQTYAVLVISSV